MNIWLIQIGEQLPLSTNLRKLRTLILAEKLIERGHSVIWWASAFDHMKKKWLFTQDTDIELGNGLKLIIFKGTGYKKNVSLQRLIDHRLIARKFRKLITSFQKPDIIVASMPSYDLAYEAVIYAQANNIPILVDIRDQWPDIFLEQLPPFIRKLARFILFREFQMIRTVMKGATGLLSMMEPLLDWGLHYAQRQISDRDKVFYLGYQKPTASPESKTSISKIIDCTKNKFIITFIGTFASYHNPSILVDAAAKLNDLELYFILAGDGELYDKIESKVSNLRNVILTGWLDQDEITDLLKHSHVGVCPANKLAYFFPNKAFSYFAEGLPVITAFEGDLKMIVEKHQVGFYYPPNDVDALVNCIKKIYDDETLYKRMSDNARKVFAEMFDADKIYSNYAMHIEKVANECRSSQ